MTDDESEGKAGDATVFGPYSFAVDYDGYRRWYASRSLKELRKGFAIFTGFSTVFMLVGLLCFVALHLGMIDASQSVGVNLLFGFCLVQWLLALLGLARPRLLLTSQRKLAKAWFEARGVNVAALELAQPDIRQWDVLMRGRLTDLGAEEHLADGYVVRLPYAVFNPEPETIDGMLCYRIASDKQGITVWTLLDRQVHFAAGLVNGTVVVPLDGVEDVERFTSDVARRIADQRKAVTQESAASVTGSGSPTPTLDAIAEWC